MARADGRPPLHEGRLSARGVFAREGFFDEATCARVREAMDRGRADAAEIHAGGYVVDEKVRRTFDVAVDPGIVRLVERAFEDVRPDASDFFGLTLGAAEGPGFLRYPPGGFYRVHKDQFDEPGRGLPRRVSLVLFLTDADSGPGEGRCGGGTLRVYGSGDSARETGSPEASLESLDIAPVAGALIAFRSHLLHEVLPVTSGVRDAIVDWFY